MLAYVLYYQVLAKDNIQDLYLVFVEQLTIQNAIWMVLAVMLMPINWFLETLKWKILVQNFDDISLWQAYKAVFAGVTFSIFTPNRVGEYGGRILLIKPENNWKAIIATLVGSFSQLLILLSMGLMGLVYFSFQFLAIDPFVIQGIGLLGVALICLMLFCFFNVNLIIPLAKKIPFANYLKKFVKDIQVLRNYSSKELGPVLIFAFLRYSVYSLQYFLILKFFGLEIALLPGLAAIATIFLLQTSFPLPPLMGLLIRGEVALFVFSFFSENDLAILASTFSLWIINLIIPALIGTLFVMNVNWLKSLGYEKDRS